MSNHDLQLLSAGCGLGAYLALVVMFLIAVIDDFRITRRERAAAAQVTRESTTPVPATVAD